MLTGNGGPLPHAQSSVPLFEGVPQGGQAGVVLEELSEVISISATAFEGQRIFVHVP